jgi:hypothetical protein
MTAEPEHPGCPQDPLPHSELGVLVSNPILNLLNRLCRSESMTQEFLVKFSWDDMIFQILPKTSPDMGLLLVCALVV